MTSMNDLTPDLIVEILTRIPITSLKAVRSTCKLWKALTEKSILGKGQQQQFLGFMTMGPKICSVKLDLQGIYKDSDELVNPSIKQIALFDHVEEISKVLHCDGLVLCVTKEKFKSRLVVWNPYLGQAKWIESRRTSHRYESYTFGYDDDDDGGNNNRSHKILRLLEYYYGRVELEIYNVRSSSWKVLDLVTPECEWTIEHYHRGVTLKGNIYFYAREKIMIGLVTGQLLINGFVLCFDFKREMFGQRLQLPFQMYGLDTVIISGIRDEKLAVLYQQIDASHLLEIWVTDKIDPNAVSWSKLLTVDMIPLTGCQFNEQAGSFFFDEEKKVVVVFDEDMVEPTETKIFRNQTAYIIGEDGYFRSVKIGENPNVETCEYPFSRTEFSPPVVSSSYLPSLLQINY